MIFGAALADDTGGDTREKLLRVAMRLFAEHGLDRFSLKTISDAAGPIALPPGPEWPVLPAGAR